jgi:hypothetical protein
MQVTVLMVYVSVTLPLPWGEPLARPPRPPRLALHLVALLAVAGHDGAAPPLPRDQNALPENARLSAREPLESKETLRKIWKV